MFNNTHQLKFTLLLLSFAAFFSFGQEICDNGIDDDADGLIDLNDDECVCESLIATSLFPNPSFEERSCCPSGYSQLYCADSWVQASGATSDYFSLCGAFQGYGPAYGGPPDFPLPGDPGDEGFVGFLVGSGYLEYVGGCLLDTMHAGTTYNLNLWIAAGGGAGGGPGTFDFTIFGTDDCADLPWGGYACPVGGGGWSTLITESITFGTIGEWVNIDLSITPLTDVTTIAFGAPCGYVGPSYWSFYVDEIILLEDNAEVEITESGGWCDGDLMLSAEVDTFGGTWQWYKDNVAILGENAATYDVDLGPGTYSARYVVGISCALSDYELVIPPFPEADFNFTNVCFGDSMYFTDESVLIGLGIIDTWEWDFGDGETASIEDPPHYFDAPGDYDVELIVMSGGGCPDTIVQTVTVFELPVIDAGPDQDICEGDDAVVTADGAGIGGAYVWTGGITDGVLFPVAATATYDVVGTDVNGCEGTDALTITAHTNPTATIAGDVALCEGDPYPTITFEGDMGTAPYTFTYHVNAEADETVVSVGDEATILAPTDVAGVYTYYITGVEESSAAGCSSVLLDSVIVTVNALPTATIAGDAQACENDDSLAVLFTGAGGTAPYTFTYTINDGPDLTITSVGDDVTLMVGTDMPGTYEIDLVGVEESSSTSCSQILVGTVTLTINAEPQGTVSGTIQVCEGDTPPAVTFSGTDGTAPYSFTYNINAGGDLNTVSVGDDAIVYAPTDVPGDFVYELTHIVESSSTACEADLLESITVSVKERPTANFMADRVMICDLECVQFSDGSMAYDGAAVTDWSWDFDNGSTSVSPVPNICYNIGGGNTKSFDVTLMITDNFGCKDTFMVDDYIEVTPVPEAAFDYQPYEIDAVDPVVTFINYSVNASLYTWNFGDLSGLSNEFEPTHEYPTGKETYQIMLIATSANSLCSDTAYGQVTIPEELLFFVPNTFTPDGDDFNDYFYPIFVSGFDPQSYKFRVYNRWGEILFESFNANAGWNGTLAGEIVEDGVYIWAVEFTSINTDEKFQYRGHINVLK